MNSIWKRKLITIAAAASLLLAVPPYAAVAESSEDAAAVTEEQAAPTVMKYQLNDDLKVELKSLLNEKSSAGSRIGIVLRLYNEGGQMTRIPYDELRVVTNGGTTYTVRASAGNAESVQPQEKVELSYMILLDRQDDFSLGSLEFVEVDEFEYPKKELTLLKMPVDGLEWKGNRESATSFRRDWGKPFTIPVVTSSLQFTPLEIFRQSSPQETNEIVAVSVENNGWTREPLIDLRIDGKAGDKVFSGQKVGTPQATLEPGEKQIVYYAIKTEEDTALESLIVSTPESFVEADTKTVVDYTVGRLDVQLSGSGDSFSARTLQYYVKGTPIAFSGLNKLIPSAVDVSLVELHMHEGEGDGYKTAIAKFRLQNDSDAPVPVPEFQTELRSADGATYIGARQTAAAETLVPGLGYIISYSFNVPKTETGDDLIMRLTDAKIAEPYRIPIASLSTKTDSEADVGEKLLSFYPFDVKINNLSLSSVLATGSTGLAYTYKLRLDVDVERRENIVVDKNFSKMKIELVDNLGRTLGSETLAFTGDNRIASGEQTIPLGNIRTEEYKTPFTIRLYETIETPFGEAKRLVKSVVQHY